MSLLLHLLLGFVAGSLIGYAHVRTLAPGVRWMVAGRAGAALTIQLGRMAMLCAAMLGLALIGPAVLAGAAVGLIVTRALLVRRASRELP